MEFPYSIFAAKIPLPHYSANSPVGRWTEHVYRNCAQNV